MKVEFEVAPREIYFTGVDFALVRVTESTTTTDGGQVIIDVRFID